MEIIEINSDLAKLLVQMESGWMPAAFSLPAFEMISFNQNDWPVSLLGIELQGSTLHIRLKGRIPNPFATLNISITATSTDGGQLSARVGDINIQSASPETDSISTLYCEQWTYTPNESFSAIAWVGKLHGVQEISVPGNLLTRRQEGKHIKQSINHLRLAHASLATYFITPEKRFGTREVSIAFENLVAEPLDVLRLTSELPLLRVVLSMAMRPDIVYAVDATGQTIGAIAFPHEQASRKVSSDNLSPVPTTYVQTQGRLTWCAPFYRHLHSFYSENNGVNAISFSLARYGHSLYPVDIDTQFELVAGAVWVLLKNFLLKQQSYKGSEVSGIKEQLLRQINLQHISALDEIESIAAYWNEVRLLPEMVWLFESYGEDSNTISKELIAANKLLESGSLIEYEDGVPTSSLLEVYDRVQRMRRAYAVLLSKSIGYAGAVNSFLLFNGEKLPAGWLRSPEINHEDEQQARQVYQAAADVTNLSVWPTYELPTLPVDALLRDFATFAEEVRYQTQGKVTARLRRLPQRQGESIYLSFRLMVNNAPQTQVALFTLEMLKKGFEVQGWGAKPLRITTSARLVDFQQSLLHSADLKYQMERLLLIEEDIRRGEA